GSVQHAWSQEVDSRLPALGEEGGVVARGRLRPRITLPEHGDAATALAAANDASREHPCRVIVVSPTDEAAPEGRLDAEVWVGADAGAGEVIILQPDGPATQDVDTLDRKRVV